MIFHRGELHALLAKAVPSERVHLAHRCTGFEQHADGVTITFENGVKASADILIGADGIFRRCGASVPRGGAPRVHVQRLSRPHPGER